MDDISFSSSSSIGCHAKREINFLSFLNLPDSQLPYSCMKKYEMEVKNLFFQNEAHNLIGGGGGGGGSLKPLY